MSSTKIPNVTELREVIIELIRKEGLTDSNFQELLDYSLELLNKQDLGETYYGYHNTNHELVVTYNTLLASRGEEFHRIISNDDFKHLFAAALFHDYEFEKSQDKPHEEQASMFVTTDQKLLNLFKKLGIDSYLVAALILRTTYPWEKNEKKIMAMISYNFSKSKYSDDSAMQDHYLHLGWFMSVSDRIGAYALGNFLDAIELAKKNAHSLGWDPEFLVRRSIVYFETLLNEEEEMTSRVMRSIPKPMRRTFMANVLGFFKARQKELEVKEAIEYDKIQIVANFEENKPNEELQRKLFDIYDELPDPLQFKKKIFFESLTDDATILVTLRLDSKKGKVIGMAKGGPLESYSLPSEIKDENFGKSNTIFMEPLALQMGYWGQGGGPKLRKLFVSTAKEKNYTYLTSLQLREVIEKRMFRNDQIEFVKQLNPQKLDYYRVKL